MKVWRRIGRGSSSNKLDITNSTGPDRKHPEVLSDIANVIARPLLITFNMSQQLGEVTEKIMKKTNLSPIQVEEPGNTLASHISTLGR